MKVLTPTQAKESLRTYAKEQKKDLENMISAYNTEFV